MCPPAPVPICLSVRCSVVLSTPACQTQSACPRLPVHVRLSPAAHPRSRILVCASRSVCPCWSVRIGPFLCTPVPMRLSPCASPDHPPDLGGWSVCSSVQTVGSSVCQLICWCVACVCACVCACVRACMPERGSAPLPSILWAHSRRCSKIQDITHSRGWHWILVITTLALMHH